LLREILEVQLADQRCAWDMQPDGQYVQRVPGTEAEQSSSQQMLIQLAERRLKQASKLGKKVRAKQRRTGPRRVK